MTGIAVCLSFAAGISCNAWAQEAPSLPAIHGNMYDQAEVSDLIATIDQPKSASKLKYVYFASLEAYDFPPDQGYSLLSTAIAQQTPGSKTWAELMAVKAFAAGHGAGPQQDEFNGYTSLFSQAKSAIAAGAGDAVETALHDYVISLVYPSNFAQMIPLDAAVSTLEAGLTAQMQLMAAGVAPGSVMWDRAIAFAGDQAACESIVADALKSPNPSYGLLRNAALVYVADQPDLAASLDKRAYALLPSDPTQQRQFDDEYVGVLLADKQAAAAIPVQQALINLTGVGYTRLVEAEMEDSDDSGVETVIQKLSEPGANPNEVFELAAFLSGYSGPDSLQAPARGITLLQNYLSNNPKTLPENILAARWMLGKALISSGNKSGAVAELSAATPPPSDASDVAQMYYKDVESLLATATKS